MQRVHDLPEPVRAVLRHVAYFICGMLFASASNLSAVSPFGVGFCAADRNKYILSAGLGAAAGYILTQDSISSLRLIAASVCAGVLARVMREFEKVRNGRLLPSCIAFLSCFLSGMAVLFANGLTGETFLLYLGEGVTAFAAAYFFSTAQYVLENGKPVRGVTLEEASAVLGSGFLIMCSLSGLTVLEVSPARMIMVFGLLFFAAIYKEAGGAVGRNACVFTYCDKLRYGSRFGFVCRRRPSCGRIFAPRQKSCTACVFRVVSHRIYVFGRRHAKSIFDYRGRFAVRGVYVFAEQPVYKGGGPSFAEGLGGERVGGKR